MEKKKIIFLIFYGIFSVFLLVVGLTITKKNLYCKEGYSLNNKKCIKNIYKEIDKEYCGEDYVLNDSICYKFLSFTRVTAENICGKGNNVDSIKEVKLENDVCKFNYRYNALRNISCKEGYTSLVPGQTCIKKYSEKATFNGTMFVCKKGGKISGTTCNYEDVIPVDVLYYCKNDGHILEKNECTYKEESTEKMKPCRDGQTYIDEKCYTLKDETKKVSSKCPSGYVMEKDKCKKTLIMEPFIK
ncbi:MAG: hypothetical protein RSH78_05470 [Bacilli bacterium]